MYIPIFGEVESGVHKSVLLHRSTPKMAGPCFTTLPTASDSELLEHWIICLPPGEAEASNLRLTAFATYAPPGRETGDLRHERLQLLSAPLHRQARKDDFWPKDGASLGPWVRWGNIPVYTRW